MLRGLTSGKEAKRCFLPSESVIFRQLCIITVNVGHYFKHEQTKSMYRVNEQLICIQFSILYKNEEE